MWLVDLDELPRLDRRCRSSATTGPPPRSAAATTWATRAARSRRTCSPTWRQRHRARRRPGAPAHQRARPRLRLQPAVRVLLPRPEGTLAASLPRCTTRTASATATCSSRASAAGRGRQGLLRLAVSDRRRPLPDGGAGARRAAVRADGSSHQDGATRVPGLADRPAPAARRRRRCARMLLRHPLMTARVTALIHLQGMKLRLRGLRRVPRPRHPPQEESATRGDHHRRPQPGRRGQPEPAGAACGHGSPRRSSGGRCGEPG